MLLCRYFFLIGYIVLCSCGKIFSQSIYYSNPLLEKDNFKNTQFVILGQLQQNIIIIKQSQRGFFVNVYNEKMGIKNAVQYKEITEDMKLIEGFNCIDNAVVFFVHQTLPYSILYGIILNANGVPISQTIALDTFVYDNKSTIRFCISDNKKHISYLLQNRNDTVIKCKQLTLNNELQIIRKRRFSLATPSDFTIENMAISNTGTFFFTQNMIEKKRSYQLLSMPIDSDTMRLSLFEMKRIKFGNLHLKIDNFHERLILYGLKTDKTELQNGSVFYINYVDMNNLKTQQELLIPIKQRTTIDNLDVNLQDAEIQSMIVSKDSSVLIITEQHFKKEYQEFLADNKMNMMMGSRLGGFSIPIPTKVITHVNYNTNDIFIFKIKGQEITGINSILKRQEQKDESYFLSHQILNNGLQLHFLYNNFLLNGSVVLNDIFLMPKGESKKLALSNKILKSYTLQIRFAKQITPTAIITPCIKDGILCFSRILINTTS